MRLINTNLLNYFYKKSIKPLINAVNGKIDKNKILNTNEEIEANTSADYAAGALAVKKISSNLSELIIIEHYNKQVAVSANSVALEQFDNWKVNAGYQVTSVTLTDGGQSALAQMMSLTNGKFKVRSFAQSPLTLTIYATVVLTKII